MVLNILVGVAACVLLTVTIWKLLKTAERRFDFLTALAPPIDWGRLWRALTGAQPAPLTVQVPQESTPEPQRTLQALNRGNIRPVLGEEKDHEILGAEVHVFPEELQPPETNFEDFNKRLFIHRSAAPKEWPSTTMDDFPTTLAVPLDDLIRVCKTHLRPAYPVIIDHYGWFLAASNNLERDNNFSDALVASYMSLPTDLRPVVVSSPLVTDKRCLVLLRYGYEPLTLRQADLEPHIRRSLDYIFQAMTGPRKEWMWFSIARMRKSVAAAQAAVDTALAKQRQEVVRVQETVRQAALKRHANRFAALWDLPEPVAPALAHPVQDQVTEPGNSDEKPTDDQPRRVRRIVAEGEAEVIGDTVQPGASEPQQGEPV